MLDELAALRLQLEWGVDEALADAPVDRMAAPPPPRTATAAPAVPELRAGLRAELPTGFPAVHARAAVPAPAGVPDAASLADLAAVHAALDAFRAHPLRATASCTVPPGGNMAAGLVVVSDAPGADDDRSGQAWSGRAGAMLDRVLGSAGLGRDAAALCFLVPWRPPGGRAPTEAEIALALPFLHRTVALLRPRHMLLLGEAPLRTLVDAGASLRGTRGRWAQIAVPGLSAPVPGLPMPGMERWLQSAASRQAAWADLMSVREAITAP